MSKVSALAPRDLCIDQQQLRIAGRVFTNLVDRTSLKFLGRAQSENLIGVLVQLAHSGCQNHLNENLPVMSLCLWQKMALLTSVRVRASFVTQKMTKRMLVPPSDTRGNDHRKLFPLFGLAGLHTSLKFSRKSGLGFVKHNLQREHKVSSRGNFSSRFIAPTNSAHARKSSLVREFA